MYLPFKCPYSFPIYLKEIKLAIEAISVPSPPRFVPTIRSSYCSVNPDNKRAAGTLLIN